MLLVSCILQEIERRLLDEGFLFICRCQTRLSRQQAEQFYSIHKGFDGIKPSYNGSDDLLLKHIKTSNLSKAYETRESL